MHTIAAVSLAVPAFTPASVPQAVQGVQPRARPYRLTTNHEIKRLRTKQTEPIPTQKATLIQ